MDKKTREEIKAGNWKNEAKVLDMKEIIYRLEDKFILLEKMIERNPENERAIGSYISTKEMLHELYNCTDLQE